MEANIDFGIIARSLEFKLTGYRFQGQPAADPPSFTILDDYKFILRVLMMAHQESLLPL
jgi:hypothetical protein